MQEIIKGILRALDERPNQRTGLIEPKADFWRMLKDELGNEQKTVVKVVIADGALEEFRANLGKDIFVTYTSSSYKLDNGNHGISRKNGRLLKKQ